MAKKMNLSNKKMLAPVALLLALFVSQANSFAGLDPAMVQHSITAVTSAADSLLHHTPHHVTSSVATTAAGAFPPMELASHLLSNYKQALAANPLQTKMMTGAVLATAGDAIAQSQEPGEYDKRRAGSFAAFDMAYRALQHASFPIITEYCRGQFLTGALASVGAAHAASMVNPTYFAAVEQTLASQLGIVPFLYYPVFFAMTGAIQGLSVEGSVERAKEKFLPLMSRNLMFWLPVQFIQFGFVEENLQVPFLSVCGLAWTFILSIMAGNANKSTTPAVEQEVADLTNMVEEADELLQEQLVFDSAVADMDSQEQMPYATSASERESAGLVYDKSY
jgi:protein Mpv17